jgi:hypothetical protein
LDPTTSSLSLAKYILGFVLKKNTMSLYIQGNAYKVSHFIDKETVFLGG